MTKKSRAQVKEDTYHHGHLKETLIQAALKLLKTKDPSQLSLRELASLTGVSQAAPYRHFKSKEELFAAIGTEGFEMQSKYMRDALEKYKDDPLELYLNCGLSYFKMGLKNPQHFRLMFGTMFMDKKKHPEFLSAASRSFVLLRNMVQKCQDAGLIGAGDPYHKSINCWAVVHGFTNLYTEGRLEWLGVSAEKAESALRALLIQYLDGNKTALKPKEGEFSPFQTEYSLFYKDMMEKIPR